MPRGERSAGRGFRTVPAASDHLAHPYGRQPCRERPTRAKDVLNRASNQVASVPAATGLGRDSDPVSGQCDVSSMAAVSAGHHRLHMVPPATAGLRAGVNLAHRALEVEHHIAHIVGILGLNSGLGRAAGGIRDIVQQDPARVTGTDRAPHQINASEWRQHVVQPLELCPHRGKMLGGYA